LVTRDHEHRPKPAVTIPVTTSNYLLFYKGASIISRVERRWKFNEKIILVAAVAFYGKISYSCHYTGHWLLVSRCYQIISYKQPAASNKQPVINHG